MENAVPFFLFWGLNFLQNLLLSFNKHSTLSILKAFWKSVSSGKMKQGNKRQNETVNAI